MSEISMIGLDLAKAVFQIHGIDAAGAVVGRVWDGEMVAEPEEMLFSARHAVLGPMVLKKQIWLNCNGETSGRLNVYHPQDDADFARLAQSASSHLT